MVTYSVSGPSKELVLLPVASATTAVRGHHLDLVSNSPWPEIEPNVC